ncbi:MAG: xanthine dehydrogenase family protein molybdopterin-binding subunit [Chloroflexi bacterium]|nr:xanthine dehydrogenase family protein molybdopterin-binding subunit [Chloroflexota bacterium]
MNVVRVDREQTAKGDEKYTVVERNTGAAWPRDRGFQVVGKPLPRVEGDLKVTGKAQYAYDVRLPGQLYARVLRSPHPHARIVRIDTTRAEAVTGVRAIVSRNNAADILWFKDTELFSSVVRYIGEEVAAVAADSEEIADDALRLIEVEYEPLPFVMEASAALRPGAPKIHQDGNIAGEVQEQERGDVAAGFAQADVVIEREYVTQAALHNCLEPHGCTAAWEPDRLTIWDSTQSIFDVRQEVARRLGLPEHRVRVVKQFMGGGFGSKQIAWKHTALAALLSKQSGRPVQLMLDREAENLAAGNRNPTRQKVRAGAKRDGTLTAIEVEAIQSVGAYMVGGEAANVVGPYRTLYRCPNVRTKQTPVYINAGPTVAFRAPGYVEGAFGLESAMDELAQTLGIDPLALRLKNYADRDQDEDQPYTAPDGLRRCYEAVDEAFGWQKQARQARAKAGARRATGAKVRGVGFAGHDWIGGAGHPPGYAWVKLNADGSVDIVAGTHDIGTGSRIGLTQIAAEELSIPVEQVGLHLGDTAYGPYAPVSSGSATQATIGPAIQAAALDAKAQLFKAAGPMLEVDPDDLELHHGQVRVKGQPSRGLSIATVMEKIDPHMIQGQGSRGPNPDGKTIHTFGAQAAEVEVDTETGEVTVLRIVAAHDCGRIINPMMVESQVIGAVTQGLGFALTEERIVDERRGVVLNANLEEYKVPTVLDIPHVTTVPLDMPDPEANPTGAKGIGESPLIPTAPAIVNAVCDALGVRIRETPLTRSRVLRALAERDSAQGGA